MTYRQLFKLNLLVKRFVQTKESLFFDLRLPPDFVISFLSFENSLLVWMLRLRHAVAVCFLFSFLFFVN